jgi:hypothetical protein
MTKHFPLTAASVRWASSSQDHIRTGFPCSYIKSQMYEVNIEMADKLIE